ncbi:tyrosine-type recombinase/integrase [Paraburkholderia dipogonis]
MLLASSCRTIWPRQYAALVTPRKGAKPRVRCERGAAAARQHRRDAPIGLSDRALIALMVFSFARVGAALAMRVEDVYVQQRRLWVHLREKGGKRHEMPCHHTLEVYLHEYLEQTGLRDELKSPLFRTIARGTNQLSARALPRPNAYAFVRRRALAAGIGTAIGQSHFPRDRYHSLSKKRRYAGERRNDGKLRVDAHHAAI